MIQAFCAVDVVSVLAKTNNPRIYWVTIKRRNSGSNFKLAFVVCIRN